MSFIVRQLRGSGNNQTIADRRVDSDEITIGRGADQDVLINDTRVAWEHAVIRQNGSKYAVQVEPDAGTVMLNGAPVQGSRLQDGDLLSVGGHEIRFRLFEGRAYLEVMEVIRGKDQAAEELRAKIQLKLAEVPVSKRRWSWMLFGLVLFFGLLFPLGARFSDGLYIALKSTPIPVDEIWDSGPISSAHQSFGDQCGECHLSLFEPVPDRACANCHTDVSHHDDDVALLNQSGIENYSCTDCHHEHGGDEALVLAHPSLCTDCHANPAQKMPGSPLLAASDFLYDHPEFSPQAWTLSDSGVREDLSTPLTAEPREDANLIYPHDLHLDAQGVDDVNGETHVLECQSCHEYQSGEVSFQPVDFEQHCQYCHSLDFDPTEPDRQAPHGNTAAVLSDLRGYYALKVLQGEGVDEVDTPDSGRGRVRSSRSGRAEIPKGLAARANALASNMIDETIRVRLCAKCHIIGPPTSAEADWDVTPFVQRPVWMTAAKFDHSRHQTETCESCHEARASTTADDILMPDMRSCHDCHGGNRTEKPLIRSLCVDCHGFHLADEAMMHDPMAMLGGHTMPKNEAEAPAADAGAEKRTAEPAAGGVDGETDTAAPVADGEDEG